MELSIQTILLLTAVVESALLLLLTLLGKFTRKFFIWIALIAGVGCGVVLFFTGELTEGSEQRNMSEGYIYIAASLLEEHRPEEALVALGQLTDTDCSRLGGDGLKGLAYNALGAYTSGAYVLKDTHEEALTKVYQACLDKIEVDASVYDETVRNVMERLTLSDAQKNRYLAEKELRFLRQVQTAEQQDVSILAQITAAIQRNDPKEAYRMARENAKDGSVADRILLAEMFSNGMDLQPLGKSDEVYDRVLEEVTRCQIAASKAAEQYGEDSTQYEEADADYALAMTMLNREQIKRSINYLLACEPGSDSQYRLAWHLELAKLYYAIGRNEDAQTHLTWIFHGEENLSGQWLFGDTELVAEEYLNEAVYSVRTAFGNAYARMMTNLYQGVLECKSDAMFCLNLQQYLDEASGGFYLERPNLSAFPLVSVDVRVGEDVELSADMLQLRDAGSAAGQIHVQEKQRESVAVCFFVNRSGMSTNEFEEERSLIRKIVQSFSPEDDVKLGLVSYAEWGSLDCPLVDYPYTRLLGALDGLEALGPDRSYYAFPMAVNLLRDFRGKKIIVETLPRGDIYLFDMMQTFWNDYYWGLNTYDISLYSVYPFDSYMGLDYRSFRSECATAEMRGIDWKYIVSNQAAISTHDEIVRARQKTYTITYVAENIGMIKRNIDLQIPALGVHTRRPYTLSNVVAADDSGQEENVRYSGYFRQLGGTGKGK